VVVGGSFWRLRGRLLRPSVTVCGPAGIAGDERVVARQDGLSVAAGEVNGAGVSDGGVAVGVQGRDGHAEGAACSAAGGRGQREVGRSSTRLPYPHLPTSSPASSLHT